MTRSARRTVLAARLALGGVLIPGAPQAAQEATLAASGRDPAQFPAYVEQPSARRGSRASARAPLTVLLRKYISSIG